MCGGWFPSGTPLYRVPFRFHHLPYPQAGEFGPSTPPPQNKAKTRSRRWDCVSSACLKLLLPAPNRMTVPSPIFPPVAMGFHTLPFASGDPRSPSKRTHICIYTHQSCNFISEPTAPPPKKREITVFTNKRNFPPKPHQKKKRTTKHIPALFGVTPTPRG